MCASEHARMSVFQVTSTLEEFKAPLGNKFLGGSSPNINDRSAAEASAQVWGREGGGNAEEHEAPHKYTHSQAQAHTTTTTTTTTTTYTRTHTHIQCSTSATV
jgi:hypothetical protein